MPKFNKSDAVAVIGSWDDKGTMSVRRATVDACGPKVTRLRYPNGEMFKAAYGSARDNDSRFAIIADADDAAIEGFALNMAERFVASQHEHFAERRDRFAHDARFVDAMHKAEAALHDPAVLWR